MSVGNFKILKLEINYNVNEKFRIISSDNFFFSIFNF